MTLLGLITFSNGSGSVAHATETETNETVNFSIESASIDSHGMIDFKTGINITLDKSNNTRYAPDCSCGSCT